MYLFIVCACVQGKKVLCGNELGDTVQCVSVFGNTLFLLEEKTMHKCNQCGHNFEGKFCSECGAPYSTAYVKEESYQSFNSEFEKEKKQCKVLLMLLNNMDLEYLKERALKVLDLNPDNSLAQMIYDCDFKVSVYEDLPFLELNEAPLENYLKKEYGNIDAETSLSFIRALVLEAQTDSRVDKIVELILRNALSLRMSENELFELLKKMARSIGDVSKLNMIAYSAKLNKVAGVLNMFNGNNYSSDSLLNDGRSLKQLATIAFESRKRIAKAFKSQVERCTLSQNQKNELYNILGDLIYQRVNSEYKQNSTATASQTNDTEKTQSSTGKGKKSGGIVLIVSGAMITLLGVYIFWPLFIMGGAMIIGGVVCISKSKKK